MKEMKYMVICPQCNRAFDCRQGILLDGELVCPDCGQDNHEYVWTFNPANDKDCKDTDTRNMKRYPDFIPNDWRDCYELPLHIDNYCVYASDKNHTPSLSNFNIRFDDHGNFVEGEVERIKKIISIINGEIESDFDSDWSVDEDEPAQINYKGGHQFLVRGWGHLTGIGNAMNLPVEIAEKMQDGFISYIINRLNGAKNY